MLYRHPSIVGLATFYLGSNLLVLTGLPISANALNNPAWSEPSTSNTPALTGYTGPELVEEDSANSSAPAGQRPNMNHHSSAPSIPPLVNRLTTLPTELLSLIIKYSYNRRSRSELLGSSKVIAMHATSYIERGIEQTYWGLQYNLQKYHNTGSLSHGEIQATFHAWHRLLYHQIAGSLLNLFGNQFKVPMRLFQDSVRSRLNVVRLSTVRELQTLILNFRGNSLLAMNGWQFIDPEKLSRATLIDELPLFALVDSQGDGQGVLEVFKTLTDRSLLKLASQDWPVPSNSKLDRVDLLREWVTIFRDPSADWRPPHVYSHLYGCTAAIMMSRLATTGRDKDLVTFVEGLQVYLNGPWPARFSITASKIQRWALILASVTRQEELLLNLPGVSDVRDAKRLTSSRPLDGKCGLAFELRALELFHSANYLENILNCPPTRFDVLTETGKLIGISHMLFIIEQLRFTDDGGSLRMAVAVLRPEFEDANLTGSADISPWPYYKNLWGLGSQLSDPKLYDQIQRIIAVAYGQHGGEHRFVQAYDILKDSREDFSNR
ncbi:hypothetical protein H4R33_002925 [Dimargaris cristalligena]|nr:hypothetical protein H4R33_002925 [Dimargaris cristalligena]